MNPTKQVKDSQKERALEFQELLAQFHQRFPHISRYKISQESGVRWNTLWTWATGQAYPSARSLDRIRKYFNKEVGLAKRKKTISRS